MADVKKNMTINAENSAEEARLAELFAKLDIDKNGKITVDELSAALKGQSLESTNKFFAKSDKDSDKAIDFKEFVKYISDQETQLRLAFKQLDKNKDDVVDEAEIIAGMTELGIKISQADAQKLLKKVDKDGSLSINFDEWREFLMLSGTSDIGEIFKFWQSVSGIDIGEGIAIPSDFTEDQKKMGVVYKTMLAGGIAGAVSRTATAPLDRLKTFWQTQGAKATQTGIIGALKQMLKEGGWASLWRGNGVNVLKIAPESAFKLVAYDQYKALITGNEKRNVSIQEKFVAGAMAGVTAQTLIYPMEVLKTRMTLRKTGQYSSIIDCARKISHEGGLAVFYRGYIPNILGIMPYAGIELALMETFKNFYMKSTGKEGQCPPIYVSVTAGGFASVCGQVATYPLALVRTRLQAFSKSDIKEANTMIGQMKYIMKKEGPIGFYRGIFPNFLKVIPAVSISYAVFDQIRYLLKIKS